MRSKPIRVLVIAPSRERTGGQSVQATRLLRSLADESSIDASFLRTDTLLPGPLNPLGSVKYARTVVRFPLYCLTLLRRIPRSDVVHVFAGSHWSFLLSPTPAVALGKLLRKKVVINYHSGNASEHLSRSRVAALILRHVDAIVVQSVFLEQAFRRFDLTTTVIPNHLEISSIPFRQRRPLRPRFLSARGLEPEYGVETVLRAFKILQQEFEDAQLHVVGDGSSRTKLESLARELGLRDVTFSGTVDADRMGEVYDDADVLLNCSTVDSMPLTLIEAFAAGLPVVSTSAGGIADLVEDGSTGLLVQDHSPDAVASAAARLLSDGDLASKLTASARSECAGYSWSATRDRWLSLYEGLARAGTSRSEVSIFKRLIRSQPGE